MTLTTDTVAAAALRGLGLADMLLQGVTPETFARLPRLGGEPVRTNHASFVYGHLSLYPARILMLAGEDPGDLAPPAPYEEVYKAGAECVDDPDGAVYPSMDEVVTRFKTSYPRAVEFVKGLDDASFAGPHRGNERYQQAFPTLGIATTFMLTSHVMMHLGQMSAWRRCMGLGPVM